ncbi:MAG: hypothetical protein ACLT8E_05215 [Akkermansia sp.]
MDHPSSLVRRFMALLEPVDDARLERWRRAAAYAPAFRPDHPSLCPHLPVQHASIIASTGFSGTTPSSATLTVDSDAGGPLPARAGPADILLVAGSIPSSFLTVHAGVPGRRIPLFRPWGWK